MKPFSAAAVVLLSVTPCGPASGAETAERPNVVLILTDDQGYGDVGIHGNTRIDTPHLDRFAREGVELTRFYCSPVCAPTRASLMTGRYYYRSGVIHTSRGGAKMHGEETTIAELLAHGGYRTGIFGKWHLGDNYPMRPQDQGFAQTLVHKSGGIGQTPDKPNGYFDPLLWRNGEAVKAKGYCTDVFFDAALEFIKQNREERFFVYLPTNAPHTPLEVSERYSNPYREKGLDETTARVYGMITNIDENVGRLLRKLEGWGLRENTLILFVGDNGPQQRRFNAGLRGRKGSTYEGGIRVPCFVQWPAGLEGGRKIDRIAAHIDLAPTLAALCVPDVSVSRRFDGENLLPLLRGVETERPERTLYFQCHRGLTPRKFQNCAAVTQRYKLVGYPGTFSEETLQRGERPVLALYDLRDDPGEERNLAGAQPEILQTLRAGYEAWFADVRESRGFQPGVIQIGSREENPLRLCRYQDGNYVDGVPRGWTVKILRSGRYEVSFKPAEISGAGEIYVRWNGETRSQSIKAHESSAVFELEGGAGVIDIWFTAKGEERTIASDNSTAGDVDIGLVD